MSSLPSLVFLRPHRVDVEVMVLPFRHLDELSFAVPDVVLSRSVNVVLGVVEELGPVSDPAYDTGNCEEDGVHVGWKSHGSVDKAAVEVDVGVKFSGDEVLVLKGDLFQLKGDLDQGLLAADFKHFKSDLV